ncbi:MAG: hypothetical protein ABIO70_04190 [Pseudomonadota bacterium]
MAVKVNAPVRLQVSSGRWTGFVRRVSARLDLLVETSGTLKIGEIGSFDLEIPGYEGHIEGTFRVRNAGERAGPYTRYILRIGDLPARSRHVMHGWMRGQLGSRMPLTSDIAIDRRASPESEGLVGESAEQALRYPRVPIEVGVPIAMRTDSGARMGTLVRFHGTEFLVEVDQPVALGGQAFFQFEVPGFDIEVYGTADLKLEAWKDRGSFGYVLGMQLMRRADRDLLLEWLQEQAEGTEHDDDLDMSTNPTDIPSSLPPDEVAARATSGAPGQPPPERGPSGRDSIREVLRRRFFGKGR